MLWFSDWGSGQMLLMMMMMKTKRREDKGDDEEIAEHALDDENYVMLQW